MINQLVVGKSYESRGGEIYTIHGMDAPPFENYPYYDKIKKQSWSYKGAWCLGKKTEYDLIREVEKVEEKQELKLEVGKTYRDREGKEVEIILHQEQYSNDLHPFLGGNNRWYTNDGQAHLNDLLGDRYDLIEEVKEEKQELKLEELKETEMDKIITPEEYLKQFKQITKKMCEITKAKNSDYTADCGDAFANFKVVEKLGVCSLEVGMITRISDKLARLVGLTKGKEIQVKDEKYEDTLLDMANYSILLAIYLKNKR